MFIMRSISRIIERTSPTGLIIGGAVLALSLPPVRNLLRSTAVTAIAGALTLSERFQDMLASGRGEMEDIVLEAKMSQLSNSDVDNDDKYPLDHMDK